ncbi:MAG TPA: hypothetical protein VHT96_17320 [Clostridia bacterium]|nr:hypothetical protein [Clostridia bacterium]
MINKKTIAGIVLAGALAITGAGAVYAAPAAEPQNTQHKELTLKMLEIHKQFKSELDNMVRNGTITRAQEDAVLKAMAAKREKFEKERLEKEKTGGKKLEKAHHGKDMQKPGENSNTGLRPQGHPHGHRGFLQDLVKDGTLTKEQADAVRKAFRTARENVLQKQ